MNWIEALILGIIQGLTEFLPVSSSGHLEIGKELLGVETTDNLTFTVLVHGATVLSTLVVFRKDIATLLLGLFRRSEEHTSELQSRPHLVCRLLLEKKKKTHIIKQPYQMIFYSIN